MTIKEKILGYIRFNGDASFANLQANFTADFEGDFEGDFDWEFAPNLIVWTGMSVEFIEALRELKTDGLIEVGPAHPLVYLIDGMTLHLPIAKRPTPKGYKTMHWIPSILTLTPKGRLLAEAIPGL